MPLSSIPDITPSGEGCQECLEVDDNWVHLRLCLACGEIGCCDNSKMRHAAGHLGSPQHPLILSFEPSEERLWCYLDQLFFEAEGVPPGPCALVTRAAMAR